MGWLEENLIDQFCSWEMLARGDLPSVDFLATPEPPFRPFRGYRISRRQVTDDGRKHSAVSGFFQSLQSLPVPTSQTDADDEDDELSFKVFEAMGMLEIQVHLPRSYQVKTHHFSSFLLSLSGVRERLSFELMLSQEGMSLLFACAECDSDLVQGQAAIWFPDAYFSISKPSLPSRWAKASTESQQFAAFECSLAKLCHFPIECDGDSLLVSLIGAASSLPHGDVVLMQVLFQPVSHPWAQSILSSVFATDGDPFFADSDALTAATRKKVATPLFGVNVRFAVGASSVGRIHQPCENLFSALGVLSQSGGNELIPLFDDDGIGAAGAGLSFDDFCQRQTRRFGMLLNLKELQSLVCFPSTAQIPMLVDSTIRTKCAPKEVCISSGYELGENLHRGVLTPVSLSPDARVRHMHVIGASGTGKSTLLINLIQQDIANGQGCAVLDPHGDLIDRILETVPRERAGDVILLDPSDEEFPIGFNILSAHSEVEKTMLASDLCSVFRRFATSWGDQMTAVFSNAILAFLESSQGGTLRDLRRFLVEKPFRDKFLKTVEDPDVVYFWNHDYKLLSGRPEGSIVTRLNSFLRPKPIRYMISQRENKLDLSSIMDEGKILLARIPQGLIGEENAHLLGSLLVVKIHQLVMGRQSQEAASRRPFWLYIDEFQHFVTNSMASILSGARKYNLGLVLAHQELHQLESRDQDVANALLSNSYSRICFRVGDQDARKLESGFSSFDRDDIQNLETGQAICRVGRSDGDFNLSVPWHETSVSQSQRELVGWIKANSREKYSRSKDDVAAEIAIELPAAKESKVKLPISTEDSSSPRRKEPIEIVEAAMVGVSTDEEQAFNESKVQEADVRESRSPLPMVVKPLDKKVLSTPGRGGAEHKALQKLVKQLAEGFDYRATIEKSLPNGGSVDVFLEKDDGPIAVEIGVTTTLQHELQNIRKCLGVISAQVVWMTPDSIKMAEMRKIISAKLQEEDKKRTKLMMPDEFIYLLQEHSQRTKTTVSKGYKVNVQFIESNSEERSVRRERVGKALAEAVERLAHDSSGRK